MKVRVVTFTHTSAEEQHQLAEGSHMCGEAKQIPQANGEVCNSEE